VILGTYSQLQRLAGAVFAAIPDPILRRMRELEARDARDRQDGTPRLERLRQVPPATGRFLAILAATAPAGQWVEIGASAGYSAMWIALAARERGARLITFEILAEKARLARETIALAAIGDAVDLREDDAVAGLDAIDGVGFCFLDAEKDVYLRCWNRLRPKLVAGALVLADNVISHRDEMREFLDAIEKDSGVDAVVVPIGMGVLVARRRSSIHEYP
jgi:predicted O-methyltransferase YrrM